MLAVRQFKETTPWTIQHAWLIFNVEVYYCHLMYHLKKKFLPDWHKQLFMHILCTPQPNWYHTIYTGWINKVYNIIIWLYCMMYYSQIATSMPPRVEGHRWRLAYSHAEHGFSLNTLYRNMCEFDSATLVVVQDDNDNVSIWDELHRVSKIFTDGKVCGFMYPWNA